LACGRVRTAAPVRLTVTPRPFLPQPSSSAAADDEEVLSDNDEAIASCLLSEEDAKHREQAWLEKNKEYLKEKVRTVSKKSDWLLLCHGYMCVPGVLSKRSLQEGIQCPPLGNGDAQEILLMPVVPQE
jgi:hypothetical protein